MRAMSSLGSREELTAKKPWERERGRRWAGDFLEFGERFYMIEARERTGTAKMDWQERVVECRFVGQHARTGAMIGLKPDCVITERLGRRLPESDRWIVECWSDLRGAPWDLRPAGRPRLEVLVEARLAAAEAEQQERMRRKLIGSTREEGAAETTALRRHPQEQQTRELHVVKKDVSRLEGTACCRTCEKLMLGLPAGATHSLECRQRMTDRMIQEESDRVQTYTENC